ncbi:hypothetical protein KY284_033562 [Solanum tuberosum]|nr:hypothetical protein KY284_033562 [Solanum tuberosum]
MVTTVWAAIADHFDDSKVFGYLMISMIVPLRFMPRIWSIWKFQEILGIFSVGLLTCPPWLMLSCHDYHQSFSVLARDYLQKLSCATELTIGSWFTEFNGLLVPELKCKYLSLELCIENFDLNGVAGLLGALPHVETLNIYMTENLVTF